MVVISGTMLSPICNVIVDLSSGMKLLATIKAMGKFDFTAEGGLGTMFFETVSCGLLVRGKGEFTDGAWKGLWSSVFGLGEGGEVVNITIIRILKEDALNTLVKVLWTRLYEMVPNAGVGTRIWKVIQERANTLGELEVISDKFTPCESALNAPLIGNYLFEEGRGRLNDSAEVLQPRSDNLMGT